MKLLWCAVGAIIPFLSVNALIPENKQQSIQQPGSGIAGHEKLDDVISASPLLSLHRAICEVESISHNELAVGKLVVSILEAHNFTVKTQGVPQPEETNSTKPRYNIYAYPDPSKYSGIELDSIPSPKVVLSSHIDTVPPHIPYSLSLPAAAARSAKTREDILISGRGTVDDKACVAVQIQTLLDLLADPETKLDPSDVALLFVVGEETHGDGMRRFSASDLYEQTNANYKAILFGEPTEGKLATGHKGISMVKIKAHGKAAHSGYPWLGRSANSMILPALVALDGLGDIPEDVGGLPRSGKYGKSTVNVGLMQGGVAGNVVAEYAEASITFRLAGGDADEVKELVTEAVRRVDPDRLLELDFAQGYGPVELDGDDVDGFDTITVNYGTDIPNLKVAEGVKRYLYGPGSILVAHGENEGLTVGDLEEALDGYKTLLLRSL
ncbi:uncharacterized protein PV06_06287 [Exophiala oligosperma]|uniref:Peptidase M20 dimerisation domain-containing protein n=2 Tax=Chaetothyriales TaxID=34395 RepID=A0A0D2DIC7_9EURO|nr:uncharacterized protein PV06_06287 [Exophiala oligosperma]KAJ9619404.1 hypothetical protein H2204_012680 [Knufia peltigerae]KIW42773.1 hypothetical protein PV06_06287 [Exophiala oligosperma]